jgi:hypothetical protein
MLRNGESFEMTSTYSLNEAGPVMISGLQGIRTWCEVCDCMTEHNTAYHEQVIDMHRAKREGGYGTVEFLIAAVLLIILVVVLLKLVGAL